LDESEKAREWMLIKMKEIEQNPFNSIVSEYTSSLVCGGFSEGRVTFDKFLKDIVSLIVTDKVV
jgi:hypothetical protein